MSWKLRSTADSIEAFATCSRLSNSFKPPLHLASKASPPEYFPCTGVQSQKAASSALRMKLKERMSNTGSCLSVRRLMCCWQNLVFCLLAVKPKTQADSEQLGWSQSSKCAAITIAIPTAGTRPVTMCLQVGKVQQCRHILTQAKAYSVIASLVHLRLQPPQCSKAVSRHFHGLQMLQCNFVGRDGLRKRPASLSSYPESPDIG